METHLNNIEDNETESSLNVYFLDFFFIDNLLKSKCLFLSNEDKQRTSMVHCTLGKIHNDRQEPEGNFSLLY